LGFQVVPTPHLELEPLLNLFVDKSPPFTGGDKGFKDAVILETVFQHACRDNAYGLIMVVSSDKVFGHQAISSRFAEAGTEVQVVDGEPQGLLARTIEKLRTMVDEASTKIMLRKHEAATTFAKRHESEILSFVSSHAEISMSLLTGHGLRQLGREREKDANDRKLEYARILSIDHIRPLSVESAFGLRALPRSPNDGRITFLITVGLEIDLTISCPDYFAEPSVPIGNASALLQDLSGWRCPETQESITVKRDLQVSASVASEGFDSEDFQDLRLERAC
jgi:hypothetical protein